MDTTVSDPIVGRLLDSRYRIDRRIARGGMATVYQAVDTRLERPVAVKVMHGALAEDAEFVRRFRREARSAAKLSHPNVVAMFDQGTDGEVVYLTMEYVAGRTLRQLLRDSGSLSPLDALELLDPILQALSAAHTAGLIHRDVKPENVLIGDDGTVKVADFGVARAMTGATSTATQGMLIGTVSYLAPEQLTEGTADARADVYSAGILLYEMLVGGKPHDGDSPMRVAYQHVNTDVPPPSERVAGLPTCLDGLVLRATARDPDVRPTDARVFLYQLRRAHTALLQGEDDPELAEDLLAFRRPAYQPHDGAEPTMVAPLPDPGTLAPPSGPPADPGADTAETPATPPAPSSRFGAIRGRRDVAVLAAVLVLVVIGGVAAWWFGIARYTHVPPLLETSRAELLKLEDSTGLNFDIQGRAFSESIANGLVVRSEPAPADRVLKGGVVEVWLSKGPERHNVPDLAGSTEAEARRLLANNTLKVDDVEHEYSDDVPKGRVIGSSPEAGERVRRATPVTLVLSRGPEPVDIPSVVGQDTSSAEATLSELGLVADITEVFHDEVPQGQVISQEPGPGRGHSGDTVSLSVSKGPEFTEVPDVRRWDVSDAEQQLRDLGFDVQVNKAGYYVGLDTVVGQSPDPGTMAPTGSVVVLEIV